METDLSRMIWKISEYSVPWLLVLKAVELGYTFINYYTVP